ncbi:TPA: MmgE/PrpD family protein, partial [Citrobacter sedlakii]
MQSDIFNCSLANGDSDIESHIAEWISKFSLAGIPREVINVAQACIADGIGVMLAGSTSNIFRQLNSRHTSAGHCSVAGNKIRTDAQTAALLNGVACHAYDFDDTSYAGIVHGTAVILPAVLAMSQELGVTGTQFLESFIVGVETEYTLGLAVTESLYERGFWATTTLGVIGAAAGVARLLSNNPQLIANAIRLAANMPVGLRAIHGTNGKPYLCGMAAKLGVEAAFAAYEGISGRKHTLNGKFGFASTCNGERLLLPFVQSIGNRYTLIDPGVAFKLYPLCSATQAAIEAALWLRTQYNFNTEEIDHITCKGTDLVINSLPYFSPATATEAQFSMQFAISCALLNRDISFEHLNYETISHSEMKVLMKHIKLVADSSFLPPEESTACPEASQVEIHLRDGTVLSKAVFAATGMPQHQATKGQLFDKFKKCTKLASIDIDIDLLWEGL